MVDEPESAVGSWLAAPETKREIAIAKIQLAHLGSTCDPVLFTLLVEILSNQMIWGYEVDEEGDHPWET